MILPFIGVFLSLTIWGTFLPVPGLTTPNDPLIRRISAAIEVTTMAKGIHDLAELATASAHTYRAPSPQPSAVHHSPTTPTTTAAPPDTSPTALAAPQTKALAIPHTKALTIYVPLRQPPHPDTSKVCIPPPGFFVPYRYRSMTSCAVCSLLTLAKVGAIVWFVVEIVLLMVRMACAVGRDVYDAFAHLTGPRPHVVDSPSALYDEIDALVSPAADVCCFPFQGAFAAKLGTAAAAAAAAATEEQKHQTTKQQKTCTPHCEMETATALSRPGQQCAPVSPAAGMGTASVGSADEVRSVMDADLDVASAWAPPYAPARHWALVVRRLENVSPFFFLECLRELFDGSQQLQAPPLPPSPSPSPLSQQQQCEENIQSLVADTSAEKRKRKRKRPSQAKRRRNARRRQREGQEGNEMERIGVDS
ncbi:hypothetical protein ATEIFO6365_0005060600 [Aspergillus terreus]|uniref:Uncharacterized protein n=1 Tax=Aspergillus terreus TaxID=33178 RepID=A0A5M3Z219_ASPTE|nr:hypothetical protein ATETN484_0008006300 [Aspergillus terreus]GFF16416.1 hypothetical protein ATEIFO6365_0005060600 [Aspergillus terreus]